MHNAQTGSEQSMQQLGVGFRMQPEQLQQKAWHHEAGLALRAAG